MTNVNNTQVTNNTYYVSKNGSDDNNGTIIMPFQTIQKAADIMKSGDTCIVREGIYRETVVPKNDGTDRFKITFKAYKGEKVEVTGLDVITSDWVLHNDNIYKTNYELKLEYQNQVFINRCMAQLARWPNTGVDLMNPTWATVDSVSGLCIQDADLLTQPDGTFDGGIVNVYDNSFFIVYSYTIERQENGKIYALANSNNISKTKILTNAGKNYFVSNTLKALDTEKEWYYDKNTKELYIYSNTNPQNLVVEAKQRVNAFDLTNKNHIEIIGFDIFGAGVTTVGGSYNKFDKINAQYVSHYANNLDGWASHREDSGFVIGGTENELWNSTIKYSHANGVTVIDERNKIVNNTIHSCGYGVSDCAPLRVRGDKQIISHNTAYNGARSIILLKGGISRSIIEYNDFYCAGLMSHDLGTIYSVATDGQNTEIRYNLVHDNKALGYGQGIYMDNGTSNFLIHHNVVYNNSGGGRPIRLNMPSNYNLIYNNTTYGEPNELSGWSATYSNPLFNDDLYGNRVENNISEKIDERYRTKTNYTGKTPKYNDLANYDFTLASNSPCINAGSIIDTITDNYVGEKPDIGAYEYGKEKWKAGCDFENPPKAISYNYSKPLYRNRCVNSSFEMSQLVGWSMTHSKTAKLFYANSHLSCTANSRSGFYGLQLGKGEDGIEQTITELEPNTTYEFCAWVKSNNSTNVLVGVKNFGGEEITKGNITSDWKRLTVIFKTGENNTSATIFAYKPLGESYAYVDDFALTYTDEEPKQVEIAKAEKLTFECQYGIKQLNFQLDTLIGFAFSYNDNINKSASAVVVLKDYLTKEILNIEYFKDITLVCDGTQQNISFDSNIGLSAGKTIEVMLYDSLESMKPICEKYVYNCL